MSFITANVMTPALPGFPRVFALGLPWLAASAGIAVAGGLGTMLLHLPQFAPFMQRFTPLHLHWPSAMPSIKLAPPSALDWEVLIAFAPAGALIIAIAGLAITCGPLGVPHNRPAPTRVDDRPPA